MSRQNTQLESAGAEFLVLGHLMVEGIPSFKSYTNTKGYDLISTNPEKNRSVRIQVKSRYRTKAEGFIINDFGCDFVVIVLLNRGDKHGKVAPSDPDYYVVPVDIVKALPRTSGGWGKISFSKFPDLRS
jgi:hypothetical protein